MAKTKTPGRKHIVVAGGGFGGVRAALQLSKSPDVRVTLISDSDTFTYYPQLYHAATGGSRSETALPLKEVFDIEPVTVIRDSVVSLDHSKRTISTASKNHYTYDELIISLGSVTNYFGIKGLPEYTHDIKSTEGAEKFKRHLHQQLVDNKKTDLHYVVIGGGPTGVELAGALDEYLERIVKLHKIKKPKYSVDLIEAAPRLLPRLPEAYAARVDKRLRDLGVNIMTNTAVEAATADSLQIKGESMKTKTVVWTSGVANNPFFKNNEKQFNLAKNGRVQVNEYLEAAPGMYVIGDNAFVEFGGLAEVAIQHANFVARDISRRYAGDTERRAAFKPRPGSSVIPVGSGWAAASWKGITVYGRMGWLLRRAADLIAYHDIESWTQAVRVWLKDFSHEDNCPVCSKAS